ncbi:MAG: RHS repeat protein, partial [Acidobacteria bacterium]
MRDASNGVVGRYYYDGEGRRVKKEVPATGETTIFVYDAFGKLIAEYSTQVAQPTEAKVSYLMSDHLGSPRVLTEQSGKVYSRRDFMPFGEEIRTLQRTEQLGYGADAVRQKFTGYERDSESGLDFAQARYFHFGFGRFF